MNGSKATTPTRLSFSMTAGKPFTGMMGGNALLDRHQHSSTTCRAKSPDASGGAERHQRAGDKWRRALCLPSNLIELWNVETSPAKYNGLRFTQLQAQPEVLP